MAKFNPYDHFGFLTNRIARLFRHQVGPQLEARGLQFPTSCIGILADLWMQDGINQKDLGMSLIKTKSSITKMLAALEADGMIEKKDDPNDKRNKLIFLTKKGKSMQNRVDKIGHNIEKEFLHNISEEELAVTKKVLKALYLNLSENLNNPK